MYKLFMIFIVIFTTGEIHDIQFNIFYIIQNKVR